jgi:hypothetical protein
MKKSSREFVINSLPLIPLHPDLVNEPFTFRDTGIRPEMRVKRPFFSFKITEGLNPSEPIPGIAICTIGNEIPFSAGGYSPKTIPEKRSTIFSILNVYDSYGLEYAYSFLHYLYEKARDEANWVSSGRWIETYILGSLLTIQSNFIDDLVNEANQVSWTEINLHQICSLLMAELGSMYGQIKMVVPLQEVKQALPPEILALITGSRRVSKEIGGSIIEDKSDPLSWAELMHISTHPRVLLSSNEVYYLYGMRYDVGYEWRINISAPYVLEYISARDIPPGGNYLEMDIKLVGSETPRQISIYDYIRAYEVRGEDGIRRTINDLWNIIEDRDNIQNILCVILVLCEDTKAEIEQIEFSDLEELISFRDELVHKMISMLENPRGTR